jgi:hypothetical protein
MRPTLAGGVTSVRTVHQQLKRSNIFPPCNHYLSIFHLLEYRLQIYSR